MKKYFFIILSLFCGGFFIGYLFSDNVVARENVSYNEEISPIKIGNNTIGENVVVTIPSDSSLKNIKFNLNIFDGFRHFYSPGEYVVNLTIDNKSKYNYKFVDGSFNIYNDEPYDMVNYTDFYGIGYDGYNIYDSFYRSYNDALLNLLEDNDSLDLSDEILNKYLSKRGYNGVADLRKYYLDYYRENYDFSKILEGRVSLYKESCNDLVVEAYNYFFSDIFKFKLRGNYLSIDKYNSTSYGNDFFKDIGYFNKYSKVIINDIGIRYNELLPYNGYTYDLNFEFELERV